MSGPNLVKVEKISKFWKKNSFLTTGDSPIDNVVKKRLTSELRNSIRSLQSQYVNNLEISGGEAVVKFCTSLEAIFIHGLKGKFSARMSSVFSAGGPAVKIPEPDFWPVVMMYSHKDVLSSMKNMDQIHTDVGRCRAWLRLALNDGIICSYLDTMISDRSQMQCFYNSHAYLQDFEHPGIMRQLLHGITMFSFQLPCNLSTLNVWSSTPLTLAGIWTPPKMPQPVMPATDVIEFFAVQEDEDQEHPHLTPPSENTFKGFKVAKEVSAVDTEKSALNSSEDASSEKSEPDVTPDKGDRNELEDIVPLNLSEALCISELSEGIQDDPHLQDEWVSSVSPSGNRLWTESGWSSEFPDKPSDDAKVDHDHESYDSLLHSYNKSRPPNTVAVDDVNTIDSISDDKAEDKSEFENLSPETTASDYELIQKSSLLTFEEADKRTQQMLLIIDKICPEVGLDQQDYQCRGCGCPIGMIYGKAKRCYFDGYSYCFDCHKDDEYYIPARIIHSWDFKKYPVAKYAKYFLTGIEQEHYFNVKDINPLIYSAFEEMAQLESLRIQLTFLRSYIFTCKKSVVEELRKQIWPREYLYENVHLYSLNDLLQVASGTLQQLLQKTVNFAKKHVLKCHMCSLKAFICEICKNSKVIYPFDIEIAYHCDHCLAVYHKSCIELKKFCPKCERKRKWKESSTLGT